MKDQGAMPAYPEWRPIESAPKGGVVLLAVRGYENADERRTYAAEMSHEDGTERWIVTTGWVGWTRLHGGWEPFGWTPLPAPPALSDQPTRQEDAR